MSMNGKLAVILRGRGLYNAADLAVASSVQKFIRATKLLIVRYDFSRYNVNVSFVKRDMHLTACWT